MDLGIARPLERFNQETLQARLDRQINKARLFATIDMDPALTGAAVVYLDSKFQAVRLRGFLPTCHRDPVTVIIREAPPEVPGSHFANGLRQANPRDSKLVGEATNAFISCSAMIVGWIVVFTSGSVIPLTGGASTVVSALSLSGALASTAQCGIGAWRTRNEVDTPDTNDWMDDEQWYQIAAPALDAISLVAATTSGLATIKMLKTMRAANGTKALDALKTLDRAQRSRLTVEIIRANHPSWSNKMLKAAIASGAYPKRYAMEQIRSATLLQLKDALGATLGVVGSAKSGLVNAVAVGVIENISE